MRTAFAQTAVLCLWVLATVELASAQQTCTWKGGTGGWSDAAQWTNGVPSAGDIAIMAAGSALLESDTAPLGAFEISGGILVFTNWSTRLIATEIAIRGGTVTHATCDTNAAPANTNRVFLSCSNLFIAAAGKINADYRGYRGGAGSTGRGQGPGGALNGGGAGHGGSGVAAQGNASGSGGPTYGSADTPFDPGSGGGGTAAYTSSTGRPGGGAVYVEATGTVTVNGSITANAERDNTALVGTGSGGSIYIRCHRFAATNGTLRADGGGHSGTYWIGGCSGGGGRIAIDYNPAAQAALNLTDAPQVYLSADGGNWINNGGTGRRWHKGRPGSLYLPDAGFFPITNSLHGGRIEIPGFTQWSVPSLTASNGLTEFIPGFSLTVSNDLTVLGHGGGVEISNGTLNVQGRLLLQPDIYGYTFLYANEGSLLTFAGNVLIERGELSLCATVADVNPFSMAGNCTISNGGCLRVMGGPTNDVSPDYGAKLAIGQDLIATTGSWVYAQAHGTNGGAPLFVMRDLSIAAGGGFNADGLGFDGGDLLAGIQGWGPGGGDMYGGGGHGGRGGRASGGETYGASNAPIAPGSGGGSWYNNNGYYGSAGGGTIRIEASRHLILNGTLTANGLFRSEYSGGGSGGAIYVRCKKLLGIGQLRANGGAARTASSGSGSGGGGRIAVWRAIDGFSGTVSVTNGAAFPGNEGQPGTVFWGIIATPGTLIQLR